MAVLRKPWFAQRRRKDGNPACLLQNGVAQVSFFATRLRNQCEPPNQRFKPLRSRSASVLASPTYPLPGFSVPLLPKPLLGGFAPCRLDRYVIHPPPGIPPRGARCARLFPYSPFGLPSIRFRKRTSREPGVAGQDLLDPDSHRPVAVKEDPSGTARRPDMKWDRIESRNTSQ